MSEKTRVLILCTGNSARSQMAEGLLKQIGGEHFDVESAGTKPSIVRHEAIQVLAEIGVDISKNRSKSVDEFVGQTFDYVVTVCDNAKENCPYFPAQTKLIHRSFEDPPQIHEADEETRLNIFRRVRDEIASFLKTFVETI